MAAVDTREPQLRLEGRQADRPGRGPIDWLGGWRTCIVGCSAFLLLAIAIRIFQQFTAWKTGIDASSRDFTYTYRVLFYAELLGSTIGTLVSLRIRLNRLFTSASTATDSSTFRVA